MVAVQGVAIVNVYNTKMYDPTSLSGPARNSAEEEGREEGSY